MKVDWLKKIKWQDVLTFLLFFVLASALWYGHAMRSVRNTHVPVLISYTGKPGSIALGPEGLPDTVMIEVRDAGQRLNVYFSEPLRLTVNLQPYIHGDKGTIRIPTDVLRRSISDILLGTSHLIATAPEEIVCTYFTEQEKSVPVVNACVICLADEYQLVGQPRLNRKRIKVYGQDKALAALDTLYTAPQRLEGMSDTTVVRVPLALPISMRAEVDSVDLTVIAERFTEKKFIIPIQVKNAPEGYQLRLFPREVEVSVRVGMSHFSQVRAEDIRVLATYLPERKDKLEVELQYTNPYITAAWAYPAVVEFLLEQ